MTATAATPCRACRGNAHDACWENDPPEHAPWLLCPCTHARPRFVVRPAMNFGLPGWTVWDRQGHEPPVGWFGASVRMAAVKMAELANARSVADA